MPTVMIDPHLYELKNIGSEDIELLNSFYADLLKVMERGKVRICIYPDILERLENRYYVPFPISAISAEDENIRRIANMVNRTFAKAILNHSVQVDIDDCGGKQDYEYEVPDGCKDDLYYGLFSYYLTKCYRTDFVIDNHILSENINGKKTIDQYAIINCECAKTFSDKITFVKPEYYLDKKEKIIERLTHKYDERAFSTVTNPRTVTDGDHHERLQVKRIESWSDISRSNRKVIDILRCFGLKEIHFGEYNHGSWHCPGELKIETVDSDNSNGSVLICVLCGELDNAATVRLAFPPEIATMLKEYFGSDITASEVRVLKEKVVG